MPSDFVRAAIAAASGTGDGREPSGDAWCCDTTAMTHPRVSAHSAISMEVSYIAARAAGSVVRDRIPNRIMNIRGTVRDAPTSRGVRGGVTGVTAGRTG